MPSAAVLTISDTRSAGTNVDRSGPAAAERLAAAGLTVTTRDIVPDERDEIARRVRALVGAVDLVVTTGGTGIATRDVTPEALSGVIERSLPGFGEAMRMASFERTPLSIISRGGAGVAGRTLVVWLPGSPRGVLECLEPILPAILHVLKVLTAGGVECASQPDAR
ncbi:MAG: MogA/MoaB family molybdenum cofactor biosynthesis protein [Phycisphaerae bacterium]